MKVLKEEATKENPEKENNRKYTYIQNSTQQRETHIKTQRVP